MFTLFTCGVLVSSVINHTKDNVNEWLEQQCVCKDTNDNIKSTAQKHIKLYS